MTPAHAPTTVLCCVRGPLEAAVVSVLAHPGAGLDVTRRCADVPELLAAAASGLGAVAVVSADLTGLDRPVVSALRADGVRVVGILESADGTERLAALGVDAVVVADEVETALVARVRSLGSAGPATAPSPGSREGEERLGHRGWPSYTADEGHPGDPEDAGWPPIPAEAAGRVVAVWGPTGAPGRSTIALTLAAELAAGSSRSRAALRRPGARRSAQTAGEPTLLVDADTYSGSLAQMAGMLDESAGIAVASRAASNGTLDVALLARLASEIAPGLRVLTGIARPSRWPEVPASSLEALWEAARSLARWTVVDCGFSIESDEMLSYDTRAPQRNGATLSALASADTIVVVGSAGPVGIQRLVRALDDLRDCGVADLTERVVVVNRVRASAVGPRPAALVRDALHRYASVNDAILVPEDQPVCDAALLAGRTLAEHAPTSAVRLAVRAVADRLRSQTGVPADARELDAHSARSRTAPTPGRLPRVAH